MSSSSTEGFLSIPPSLSENAENIDALHKTMKKGISKKSGSVSSGRRTLSELKSNTLRSGLVGNSRKDFVVFEDKEEGRRGECLSGKASSVDKESQVDSVSMVHSEVQTQISGEELDSHRKELTDMYREESGDESYWKELAEKRLEALNESLHENESLHIENADLHYQVSTLQENLKVAEEIVKEVKTLCLNSSHGSTGLEDEESA
eukprot:TRINITY_DN3463_c0_g1_i1.p1 TRINITY_DN3463_c0_g1~~TRINITY_DN3463_c0_g1_i1.p1  ORF type:complete len:206 (-),score=85.42 TRINITY_DN3463_c0_g1_i1:524-1141(-)